MLPCSISATSCVLNHVTSAAENPYFFCSTSCQRAHPSGEAISEARKDIPSSQWPSDNCISVSIKTRVVFSGRELKSSSRLKPVASANLTISSACEGGAPGPANSSSSTTSSKASRTSLIGQREWLALAKREL